MAYSVGPPVGLLMGAWATSFYVDFDRIPAEDIPAIPQDDPRWIGAWWIGCVVCFVLLLVFGFPAYFYPRSMAEYLRDEEVAKRARRQSLAAVENAKRRSRQSLGENIQERKLQAKGNEIQ